MASSVLWGERAEFEGGAGGQGARWPRCRLRAFCCLLPSGDLVVPQLQGTGERLAASF